MKRKRLEDDGNNNNNNEKRSKVLLETSDPEIKEEFVLTPEIVANTVLETIANKKWRVGKPIGKGSFGEIFLATDDVTHKIVHDDSAYVAKIEPVSWNG